MNNTTKSYEMPRPTDVFWGCGVIVLNEKNEVLLGLRADSKKWGLPGGKIELNESAIDGAFREMFEETGLVAKSLKFIEEVDGLRLFDNYTPKKDFNFLCVDYSGKLMNQPEEVLDLKWVPLNRVTKEDLFECSRLTLTNAEELGHINLI